MSSSTPQEAGHVQERSRGGQLAAVLIALAGLIWAAQLYWFWPFCGRNINADAISYIGIARHIAAGNFKASVNGYWSPLISWLIAVTGFTASDGTLAARILMLVLFAVCLALCYWLTYRLWGSRVLAAMVVLWFTLARGVAAFSVCFIGADFLLTACVLVYFIRLLGCLEKPDNLWQWLGLGLAHGIAFLAKAISLPLFAITTVLAVLAARGANAKRAAVALACAAIFPILAAAGWGMALRQKYDVFTTGYQLRFNLLDPAARQAAAPGGLAVLHDSRSVYDSFMVSDQMPPGSPMWRVPVWRPGLLRQILRKEAQNIPQAIKEFLVLLTPGGILALLLGVIRLTRGRQQAATRFRFLWIVLLTTAALVVAYCMLVFDGRYILPVTAVLMALSVRFAVPPAITRNTDAEVEKVDDAGGWQTLAAALLVAGLIGVQVYWASPFRTMSQDYQASVRDAAFILLQGRDRTLVVIGEGPYPEHGVGWEAGVYTAYYAEARVVGDLFDEPGVSGGGEVDPEAVVADIKKLAPDAVLIWDERAHPTYNRVLRGIQAAYPEALIAPISDLEKGGDVATVIVLKQNRQ